MDNVAEALINPWQEAHQLAADQSLAKEISRVLVYHYPGHLWAVSADSKIGMVYVENWALSEKNGFRIRMNDLSSHDAIKKRAIWAGGEFLERFNLPRSKAQDGVIHEMSRKAPFS